jgi:hypothetical protein
MPTFTELLDEYLDAKADVDRLRESFDGYGFSDVYYREVDRLDKAKDALNAVVSATPISATDTP